MAKKYLTILFLACLVLGAMAACSSQTSTPAGNPPANLSGTMPANPPSGTMQAAAFAATTTAPTAAATTASALTSTPAPTATATPVTFESTVITSIMCLSGPADTYAGVDYLKVGTTLVTLGRDAETNYFLVQAPSLPGKTCWVWKNYITVNGNGYTLPVATVGAPTK